MRSVADRNVVMRRIPVYVLEHFVSSFLCFHVYFSAPTSLLVSTAQNVFPYYRVCEHVSHHTTVGKIVVFVY
jgi:hypothetical protein